MDLNHNKIDRLSLNDLVGKKLLNKSHVAYELLAMEPRFVFHALLDDYPEGTFFIKDNKIHCPFGIPTVEHEIAHIVEMQDLSRICLPDWGFMPAKENPKKMRISPSYMTAVIARETRVRNIQKILTNHDMYDVNSSRLTLNLKGEYNKELRLAAGKACNASSILMSMEKHIPYARFKSYNELYEWVIHIAETTQKNWNIERIRHEWDIKLNIMREYMDTHVSVSV